MFEMYNVVSTPERKVKQFIRAKFRKTGRFIASDVESLDGLRFTVTDTQVEETNRLRRWC
jgi:hypothetical protein